MTEERSNWSRNATSGKSQRTEVFNLFVKMASAPSAEDLQMAILELDILYEDLTQHRKERKTQQTTAQHVLSPQSYSHKQMLTAEDDDDEQDYDVPRPAESVFNSPILNTSEVENTQQQQHRNITPESETYFPRKDEDDGVYPNLPNLNTRSPAISIGSKHSSSGIGTLRINSSSVAADVHSPNDDSDYDVVASDAGEESDADYSYPVKRLHNTRVLSSNHRQTDEEASTDQFSSDVDPDYDDVCSNSSNGDVNHSDRSTNPEFRTRENQRLSKSTYEAQLWENPARRITFSGTVEDLKQIPIEYADEEVRECSTLDSHSCEVVVETSSNPDRDSYSFGRKSTNMKNTSVERQYDDDCPCDCPSAVPLMSCAVIICVAMLIFAGIAYIYFGMRIDNWSRAGTPADDGSAIGG